MEGLPVRQWRKIEGVVNTAPPRENLNIKSMRTAGWKELPMPRGSEMYTPTCQALLRAARIGQVYRPPPPPLEDEKDPGDDEDPEGEIDAGFIVSKWSQVPKNLEEPEPEFLAKRRKGLPSVYGGIVGPLGNSGQMRKTKVRKVDVEGNAYVWDVLVPEGTVVEGEIVEDEAVMAEAPAPGTVVEGVGIANAEGVVVAGDQVIPTPPRRRPPPPKRKPKGPGRGRKRKMLAVNGNTGTLAAPISIGSMANGVGVEVQGSKQGEQPNDGSSNHDAEMGDDSMLQDGEEGSEDEDEEGEDVEDGDREEGELSPSPDLDAPGSLSGSPVKSLPRMAEPSPASASDAPDQNIPDIKHAPDPEPAPVNATDAKTRDQSSSPDVPLAAAQMQPLSPTNLIPSIQTVEPEQEATNAPAPSKEEIQPENQILVEEPEPTALDSTAELPPEHNPLDGLVEPQSSVQPKVVKPDPEEIQRFPDDGEEDLLGSLERHLNGTG